MRRTILKSKIHRATVTQTDLEYEGSLTIDSDLLDAADILPHEQIHVWDVTNGTRLITYALPGDRGTGIVRVNGAGAHLIHPGDIVIIATFTELKSRQAKKYKPLVVFVDADNKARSDAEGAAEKHAPESGPSPAANGEVMTQRTRKQKQKRSARS